MELYENKLWSLLAKKLAEEATEEELLELEKMSIAHPEIVYAAKKIEDLWSQQPPSGSDVEEQFQRLISRLKEKRLLPADESSAEWKHQQKNKKRHGRWLVLASAGATLALPIAYFLIKKIEPQDKQMRIHKQVNEVYSQPGSKTKLTLPDSSVVWLNADSRLEYGSEFGKNTRNVQLIGEAFFQVQPSTIPFIVKTGTVHIKVLGTAFNVRSYPGEKSTETSLIHGKVEITMDRRPDEKYILKPNEKLVINNDTASAPMSKNHQTLIVLSTLTRSKGSLIVETSWVENKLVFENESFQNLARRMSRWYNVEIEFADDGIKQLYFTGIFHKETIYQALEALQYSASFQFKTENEKIILYKN